MTTPTPDQQAAADASMAKQVADLAAKIAEMTKLGFDPMTIRKGIIAAVSDTTVPPTVALNISGDTDTLISEVRTINNYTPLVGQTVLLAKQGTEIFLLGAIASGGAAANLTSTYTDDGWTQATLTNGSHNGNSNGNIEFRRILDHGSWKMQWRGGWTPSGSTTMIGSANALDTDYRPSVKRSIVVARQIQTGATAVQFDFQTDGTVTLVGETTAPSLTIASVGLSVSTDVQLSGYLSQAGSDLGHAHGGSTNTHIHSGSTVSVSAPTWVSLNGVEYFL